MSIVLRCVGLVLILGLAACAGTPASTYYSLRSPLPEAASQNASASDARASKAYAISVQSVKVPQQVDRPQIVVSDEASAQVYVLESYLWAAPLSDEIRAALSAALQQRLGVFDLALTQVPDHMPAWKVAVTIQRFESVYDRHVALSASWVIDPVNQTGKKSMVCGTSVTVPVQGTGVGALVQSHRQALDDVARMIASGLKGGSVDGRQASSAAMCT